MQKGNISVQTENIFPMNTLSWKDGAEPVRWICEGDPSYEIGEGDRDFRGTDIILHVSEDSVQYLEDGEIEGLLNK